MTIFFIIVFTVLIIALIGVIVVLVRQTKKEKSEKITSIIKKMLDDNEFVAKRIFNVSKQMTLAVNKKGNKLAVIENADTDEGQDFRFYIISANVVMGISRSPFAINMEYVNQGTKLTLAIETRDKEIDKFIHDFYKNAIVKRLQEKYSINTFQMSASSDWECSYVWAFKSLHTIFAYYKTTEKKAIYKLNLLREFFTIDVKFEYFEAPILGIAQQLNIYEPHFLNNLFHALLNSIKQNFSLVVDNRIYYDVDNDIVYLTNGTTNLQSILLKETEDVFYKEDRLTFSLTDKDKVINFPADKFMLEEFETFITNYNLRKIATKFDYEIDKLINTTEGTKFIIDASRDRMVYCAGLKSIAKFSYLTIMFNNLESATFERSKDTYFVRIHTKDKQIIDVSCKKSSVAQYILAQITTIINS